MDTSSINHRYTALSLDTCCLSCGGAINYAAPEEGECCVDLGSGRGTDVLRMAEKVGEKGFVYGIDVSDGMIDAARKNAEKLEAGNVQFIKSDLEKLPLSAGSIDLVISNCTINHASDKTQVWNEVYRILKPGGRFVVSDIYATEPVPELYRNDPVAVSECWAGAVTRDEYINTLKNAGFNEIKVLEESKPYNKGLIKVASITIFGKKAEKCCCECLT
ncbi:MAG TPA: methyltransferase domain-containing protein [Bacteroidales bacterium]|jgi:ubiquinone/menaquinone biosynthesis C-methylase UbiE|nr:methyltransferase domain-containing protein [Bacteroidales bacterium]